MYDFLFGNYYTSTSNSKLESFFHTFTTTVQNTRDIICIPVIAYSWHAYFGHSHILFKSRQIQICLKQNLDWFNLVWRQFNVKTQRYKATTEPLTDTPAVWLPHQQLYKIMVYMSLASDIVNKVLAFVYCNIKITILKSLWCYYVVWSPYEYTLIVAYVLLCGVAPLSIHLDWGICVNVVWSPYEYTFRLWHFFWNTFIVNVCILTRGSRSFCVYFDRLELQFLCVYWIVRAVFVCILIGGSISFRVYIDWLKQQTRGTVLDLWSLCCWFEPTQGHVLLSILPHNPCASLTQLILSNVHKEINQNTQIWRAKLE